MKEIGIGKDGQEQTVVKILGIPPLASGYPLIRLQALFTGPVITAIRNAIFFVIFVVQSATQKAEL
jgi:hypothetical protein